MRIIDVGEQGGLPYVVRELIDGINLRALGVLGVALSVPVALTLAHQMASVLAYVHRKKEHEGEAVLIAHGALAPSAVIVTREGEAMVTPMGLGRLGDAVFTAEAGVRLGQAGYRAPEQVAGSELSCEADIYALGLIIAELLGGGPVVDLDADATDVAACIRERCEARDAAPDALKELLLEMTAVDPSDRPADSAVVSERIALLLADLGPPGRVEDELAEVFNRITPMSEREAKPISVPVPPVTQDDIEVLSVESIGGFPPNGRRSSFPASRLIDATSDDNELHPTGRSSPPTPKLTVPPPPPDPASQELGPAADDGVYLLTARKTLPPTRRPVDPPRSMGALLGFVAFGAMMAWLLAWMFFRA